MKYDFVVALKQHCVSGQFIAHRILGAVDTVCLLPQQRPKIMPNHRLHRSAAVAAIGRVHTSERQDSGRNIGHKRKGMIPFTLYR